MLNSAGTPPKPATDASKLCTQLARTHYENFPVGRFIRKDLRPDIHAIYAFARTADDFADEPAFEGQRLKLLQQWRERLYRAAQGDFEDPVFEALAQTLKRHQPPLSLLDNLISAFEFDVTHPRHPNFESLLAYSQNSANPVGRLVLWVHGVRGEDEAKLSDAICTALQLTNFWQDVAIDLDKNRIYLPQDLMASYGLSDETLFERQWTPAYEALLQDLGKRTHQLFMQGRPLCTRVNGRLAFELRCVWSGGYRILESLERRRFDVFSRRPTLSRLDQGIMLWRTLFWKSHVTPQIFPGLF